MGMWGHPPGTQNNVESLVARWPPIRLNHDVMMPTKYETDKRATQYVAETVKCLTYIPYDL